MSFFSRTTSSSTPPPKGAPLPIQVSSPYSWREGTSPINYWWLLLLFQSQPLRVLSYNVNFGLTYNYDINQTPSREALSVLQAIQEYDADVCCLQETNDQWELLVENSELRDIYPYQSWRYFGSFRSSPHDKRELWIYISYLYNSSHTEHLNIGLPEEWRSYPNILGQKSVGYLLNRNGKDPEKLL